MNGEKRRLLVGKEQRESLDAFVGPTERCSSLRLERATVHKVVVLLAEVVGHELGQLPRDFFAVLVARFELLRFALQYKREVVVGQYYAKTSTS